MDAYISIKPGHERKLQILNLLNTTVTLSVMFDTLDFLEIKPGYNVICLCSREFQQLLTVPCEFVTEKVGIFCDINWMKNLALLSDIGTSFVMSRIPHDLVQWYFKRHFSIS